MKHPSEYEATPFNGMHVMVVDAGTKVTDERSGQTIEITDSTSAAKGALLYCTQAVFDALKARISDSN